jgi:hypothetical protein
MRMKYTILVAVFIMAMSSSVQAKDCSYWHDLVGVKNVDYFGEPIDEKDSKKIIEGIECLLKLEGVRTRGSISGATHNQVSQILPQAKVEVTALHYISYLFYERFDYASGVALRERKNQNLNTRSVVKKAYASYRRWFKKVKEIGLEEARKQKLDPLEGTSIRWY